MSFNAVRFTTWSKIENENFSLKEKIKFIDKTLSKTLKNGRLSRESRNKNILDVFVCPEYTIAHKLSEKDFHEKHHLYPYKPISKYEKNHIYVELKKISKKYKETVVIAPLYYTNNSYTYNVSAVFYKGKPVLKQFKRTDDCNPMRVLDQAGNMFSSPNGQFRTKDTPNKKGVKRGSAFFDIGDIKFGLKNCIDESAISIQKSIKLEKSRKPDFQITVSAGSIPGSGFAKKGYVTSDYFHTSSAFDMRNTDSPELSTFENINGQHFDLKQAVAPPELDPISTEAGSTIGAPGVIKRFLFDLEVGQDEDRGRSERP